MPQSTLTIVTEVARDRVGDLEKAVEARRSQLNLAFKQIETLHFARLVIVPDKYDLGLAPQLLMALVFDGTPRDCVEQLVAMARTDLDALYAACPEYEQVGPKGPVVDFLLAHHVEAGLFYHGAEDVSVATIRAMSTVRNMLRARLDGALRNGGLAESPFSLAGEARQQYDRMPETTRYISLPEPDRRSKLELQIRTYGWVAALVATAVAFGALVALTGYAIQWAVTGGQSLDGVRWPIFLGVLALILPIAELVRRELTVGAQQQDQVVLPEPDHLLRMLDEEDCGTQNALTHCSVVEGTFRRIVLALVFKGIGWRVKWVDALAGSLGGITSIHFGRWVLIDKGKKARRLIFMADYDGSWESYLGEFVDRAAKGLSAVWGNTRDFPATLLLVNRGASDEQRFKSWTRANQVSTPVWFSAYPQETLRNIENNLRIARGVPAPLAPPAEPAWLASL